MQLLKAGMQLDLGGIAKGYAADEALQGAGEARHRRGPSWRPAATSPSATRRPGKPGWTIAIAPVDATKEAAPATVLANAAVSTSGDAEQYVEIDGKRYSHIVDPKTGMGLVGPDERDGGRARRHHGGQPDQGGRRPRIRKRGFEIIEQTKGVSGRYVRKTDRGTEVFTSKHFPKLAAVGPART